MLLFDSVSEFAFAATYCHRHNLKTTIMATQNPRTLRSLYRSLLRELPPRPVLSRERSPLHTRLRATFADDSSAHPRAAHEVEQFVAYLRAQRTYTTLLERYNPGMNMDEEERVRLTARRVGMDLPQLYNDRIDRGNKK